MAQTRRIGHFIETDIAGGAEQVMIDLARYTTESGTGLTPVILHFGHPWISEQCNQYGIEQQIIPFRKNFKSTMRLPLFALEFAGWLRKQHIDVLHSHLFGPITGASLAAFIARIPHVGTLHDVYMIQEKPLRRFLLKLSILEGTRLVTVSRDMEQFYHQQCHLKAGAIRTIYNGLDSPVVTKDKSEQPVEKSPVIICVGRLVKLKNVDLILRAAHQLAKNQRFQLWILGEGPESETLKQSAGNLLGNTIQFHGVQDNVDQWLAKADIFVQFSSTEGLSRSILEAAYAGLPAVVSDVGGNREIIHDNVSGFVIESGNVDQLVQALTTLLQNRELRQQFGETGRTICAKTFAREPNNNAYLNLYKSLIGTTV